jgi:NAD(P)-dependent dehydrogenase (short-subunit alcohol dehydrogenase family)
MARFAVEQFGRIDALIDSAALFSALLPKRSALDIDLAQWARVIAVDVRGPFVCCRVLLPQTRRQKSGSIVKISSNTVLGGVSGLLHYMTSKSAQLGISRAPGARMRA